MNVYQAGLLAMRRALEGLDEPAQIALIDGRRVPELSTEQRAVAGGDRKVGSIAAASVVAAGYSTAEHLRALFRRGPTPVHRNSFAPVRNARGARGPGGA